VLNRVSMNTFSKAANQAKEYPAEFSQVRLASARLHERNAYKEALAESLGVVEIRDSKVKNEI
jgi:chromosome partitioning protein